MNSSEIFEEGEICRWQGRPAPRCYVFRHWRHAIFGLVFLTLCAIWQFLGIGLAEEYQLSWLVWLPAPFVLMGCYFAFGPLLLARLEWPGVEYAITDQRLLIRRGWRGDHIETLDLSAITYFKLTLHGEQLGTIVVHQGVSKVLRLHCVECPRQATDLLEAEIAKSGRLSA